MVKHALEHILQNTAIAFRMPGLPINANNGAVKPDSPHTTKNPAMDMRRE